jgi:hypothetical protein
MGTLLDLATAGIANLVQAQKTALAQPLPAQD